MNYDIKRHDGDNIGGINKYAFAFAEDVDIIPPIFEGAIHTEIKLKPGKRWYEGYGTEGTMVFTEDQQGSDHGDSFPKKFKALVPKHRAEIIDAAGKMRNRKFVLMLYDNNGQKIFVGTNSEPLYFKNNFDSKNDPTGRNEHEFIFSGDGTIKAPIFKGLCPLTGL